jgi:hypothetical protein
VALIEATPGMRSRRGFSRSSSSARSCSDERSPLLSEIESDRIGSADGSNSRTVGAAAPAGSPARTISIRARTAATASLASMARSNWTSTSETLSCDVELTDSTPLIDATASSIGRETERSTSAGLAPV